MLDTPAMEYYFEKMAARGWMLKDGSGGHWIFEKQEPRDIRFSVAILGDVSVWEKSENEQSEEFRLYCESAGWHFLFAEKSMQILWSENKDILPIETDETLKFEMARKQCGKLAALTLFITMALPLIVFFPISFTGFGFFRYAAMTILEFNLGIAAGIIWLSSALGSVGNMIFYLIWRIISTKHLEKGKQVWYCRYPLYCAKEAGLRLYILLVLLLFYWGGVRDSTAAGNWSRIMGMTVYLLGFFACYIVGLLARKKGYRWYYLLMNIIFILLMTNGMRFIHNQESGREEKASTWMTDDEPFLTPETLQLPTGEWESGFNTRNTSILLDQENYSYWVENWGETEFSYTLYKSDFNQILSWIKKGTDNNPHYKKTGDWWEQNIHIYTYFYTELEEEHEIGVIRPENNIPRNFNRIMLLKNGPYMLKIEYKIIDWNINPETIANLAANKLRTLPGIL